MRINFKKELEAASKSMILVHEPDTLIRMILRTIVQKVNVRHACMLLQDKNRDTYVLTVSRGSPGLKIPMGFVRVDADNPLIYAFRDRAINKMLLQSGILVRENVKKKSAGVRENEKLRRVLEGAVHQMEIFDAVVAVPTYFRDDLLGLLLLGRKKNNRGFSRNELNFFNALASSVAMAIRNAQLFKDLEEELNKKRRLFFNTTVALTAAIDAKDHYTHGHTSRVTNVSLEIAQELRKKNPALLNDEFIDHLQIASLLHDIGKIGIPETILNKNGPLDEIERKRMQEHPLVGVSILEPIKELEDCVLGVKYHHERYDGLGYPEGLKGGQIPLTASIISVADAFDAMITDRPYRKGLSKEDVVETIGQERGRQFDPSIIDAFLELYRSGRV